LLSDLLSAFDVDIDEVLDDLRYEWELREESKYNPNALRKKPNTHGGGNIMFCCPAHSESVPSCGIKLDYPYLWNCFGCGASGDLSSLVSTALGLKDELQGYHYILKNYLITATTERKPIDINALLDGNDLDRKRSRFEEDVQQYVLKRHSYITRRGFSEQTIRKYEIGYDEVNEAVTFPIRTSKGLVRFIKKRSVNSKKFLNESGIDKKDVLYGLYYILQAPKPIVEIDLNESETDTCSCYESGRPACAILGRILFKEQVRELVKSGIRSVNLFFDNDKAGVECTIKAYQMLSNMTAIRVNVVIYPEGHWGIDGTDEMRFKDANDLLKKGRMKSIRTVPFQEFLSMIKHKNDLDVDWNFV
jgi:DNA primase